MSTNIVGGTYINEKFRLSSDLWPIWANWASSILYSSFSMMSMANQKPETRNQYEDEVREEVGAIKVIAT